MVPAKGQWRSAAGKVTASLAESNGGLPPGGWLQVDCLYTRISPGPTLGPFQLLVWTDYISVQTVSNVCLKRTGLLDTCAFSASVLDDNRAVYFRSDVVFGHQILLSWLIDWVEGHTRHKIGHPTQCLGFVLNIAFGKKHKSTHTHTHSCLFVYASLRDEYHMNRPEIADGRLLLIPIKLLACHGHGERLWRMRRLYAVMGHALLSASAAERHRCMPGCRRHLQLSPVLFSRPRSFVAICCTDSTPWRSNQEMN